MDFELLNIQGMNVKSNQDFLILEDEGQINSVIKDSLEILGFNGAIYQTYSIEEAQKILKTKHVDYILSDWNLPDGKGVSLLKAVRSTPRLKDVPFLMITGNNDIESMVTSSKLGVSEYLVKPFDADDLEKKLVEGWKYHLVKEEEFIKTLESKIKNLESEVEDLRKENSLLKQKISKES